MDQINCQFFLYVRDGKTRGHTGVELLAGQNTWLVCCILHGRSQTGLRVSIVEQRELQISCNFIITMLELRMLLQCIISFFKQKWEGHIFVSRLLISHWTTNRITSYQTIPYIAKQNSLSWQDHF